MSKQTVAVPKKRLGFIDLAEGGMRDAQDFRGLGIVYKRQDGEYVITREQGDKLQSFMSAFA